MGFRTEVTRTLFFQELAPEMRKKYLSLKREKFLPSIDNLYFSVFISGDKKILSKVDGLSHFLEKLEEIKQDVVISKEPIPFGDGLEFTKETRQIELNEKTESLSVTQKSYTMYAYCLTEVDLYDIFICKAIPNEDTPRIVVQLRALGLWTHGVDAVLIDAYTKIERLLAVYGCTISKTRENRIDYCFHTNAISNVGSLLRKCPRTEKVKYMHSNLAKAVEHSDCKQEADGLVLKSDYICFGKKKSNNVRARIYDKVKEVIENGYKDFFFKLWYDNGLISYYDKWCMEYAYPHRNMDYLYKAAVAFYVEHHDYFKEEEGEMPDYLYRCIRALDNAKTTLADFKALAKEYMPNVTPVLNIEYETKRKFYYYSDKFINNFKVVERPSAPAPLTRIYKILDNKGVFLEYLTRKTLSFQSGKDKNDEPIYLAWWKRLRNVKLGGIKADATLLREYSCAMDKQCVQRRAIKATATLAVHNDNLETDYIEDYADALCDLTDNQARKLGRIVLIDTIAGFRHLVPQNKNVLQNNLLRDYAQDKVKKEMRYKNRKARREAGK
ncbi:MAG: hypothetical protein FWC16_12860 [Defluviitaleaceae bacterium]|nr:hypothetical protein [Defluviitaleaceae bacterium]MCL2275810.1 hypothetical protein [Defluviitaleaceae bacterium]